MKKPLQMKPFFALLTLACVASGTARASDIELLPFGNFAETTRADFDQNLHAAGFAGQPGNSLEWMTTAAGESFVSLVANSEKGENYFICQTRQPVPLDPNWQELTLKAVYRVNEIEPDATAWKNFRFRIEWLDSAGEVLPNVYTMPFKTDHVTDGWQVGEEQIQVPAGATGFRFDFGSGGAPLRADVARISLAPAGVVSESGAIPGFDDAGTTSGEKPGKPGAKPSAEVDADSYL